MIASISASKGRFAPRFRLFFITSTSVLSLSSAAVAQQSASPTLDLPTIVVSPTGVPTPTDQIANSVTVITAEQIAIEQRRTVPDALATAPGLNIVQSGGPGGQTSVFIRGTNSNHVKVLIDGIDVSDPSNPNNTFDFGQLLTGDVERIEVLRGPQSGLYGSDAIGGVISIVTKKGEGAPKVSGTIEGGSFGTLNQKFGVSGSQSIFNYAFTVNHFRSTDTPVTPLELLAPGERRNNDAYDNLTLSTKLGADINETLSLNYVGRYTDSSLHFTGDDFSVFPSIPAASQSLQNVHEYFTRGEVVTSFFDGRLKNYAGVNYSDTWNLNASPGSDTTRNAGQRLKYDWRSVIDPLPGETIVLGADQQTDRLWQDDPQTNARQRDTGLYAELQSNLYDRVFMVSNIRRDDNDTFGQHVTYRLAPAVLIPTTDTKLKASYGTGFKAPTLSELFVSFPAFGFFGNPNLLPETSRGYDVGFEQPIANDRLRFGATYFQNNIRNLITENDTFTSYANVGRAKTWGVESFASFTVYERLKLRADYTLTRAIDATTDDELLRRPRHKGSLTATWTPIDPLALSATLLAVSSWIDVNRSGTVTGLKAPGYTIVNLAGTYTIDEHVSLFTRVDNLFNLHYQDPTGFLRPGLGVYGGMKLTL